MIPPQTAQPAADDPGEAGQSEAGQSEAEQGVAAQGAAVACGQARLSVLHETLYEYVQPVEQAQHIVCLRPLSDPGQELMLFDMSVSPTPAQHSTRRDSHGNSRAYFALHAAHQQLRVVAYSQVRVTSRYAGLEPHEGPTCGEVRQHLTYRAHAPFEPASEFLYASPYVPLHDELRDWAMPTLADERPLAEAAIELMQRIHAEFKYAPASTDISTPILDVFAKRRGVCQDFAHLMIGCLRACGLAARYVSGYLLTRPPPGQAPLVGADASHAWLSVWVPGLGQPRAQDWLDLDPTNDVLPDIHHVRVAHGRDFGDVTPLRRRDPRRRAAHPGGACDHAPAGCPQGLKARPPARRQPRRQASALIRPALRARSGAGPPSHEPCACPKMGWPPRQEPCAPPAWPCAQGKKAGAQAKKPCMPANWPGARAPKLGALAKKPGAQVKKLCAQVKKAGVPHPHAGMPVKKPGVCVKPRGAPSCTLRKRPTMGLGPGCVGEHCPARRGTLGHAQRAPTALAQTLLK